MSADFRSDPSFKAKLTRYAELICGHGINVQEGQIVTIGAETLHRDFVVEIAKGCYERGAKFVDVDLGDARIGRARIDHAPEAALDFMPNYSTARYEELVDSRAASLRLLGSEDPDLFEDADPKRVNRARLAGYKAAKRYYDDGIGKSLVHWTVAAAATPKWGQKLFPDLGPDDACEKLWHEIFKICRVDQENCLELWKQHDEKLRNRAEQLTDFAIRDLHFTGPGTDLHVALSEKALFKGGTDVGPYGARFEPNLPTEECFTTPDYRGTHGKVRTTRPFLVNGKLIEGLELSFKDGQIDSLSAKSGEDVFREYSNSDPGASRLGEVALVGIDSPIYQSGLVFEEILFDENAACHIAIGKAYKFCLRDGESMPESELESLGCNDSSVHTDMMISTADVDCIATLADGSKKPLIKNGEWAI